MTWAEAALWAEAWRHAWNIKALKLVQWMPASAEYYKGQKETPWDTTKRDISTTCKKWTR